MTKRKILVLTANPINNSKFPTLNLDKEVREIKAGLRRSLHRDEFEIISECAVHPQGKSISIRLDRRVEKNLV